MTGYYSFIQTGIFTNGTSKNIRKNGNSGGKGSNAKTCGTYAKQVTANSLHHIYVAIFVPMFTINTRYSSSSIHDPDCPVKYVGTVEAIKPRNPIKHLNASLATKEYKKILLENMENPVFSNTLHKAFDAINSVL